MEAEWHCESTSSLRASASLYSGAVVVAAICLRFKVIIFLKSAYWIRKVKDKIRVIAYDGHEWEHICASVVVYDLFFILFKFCGLLDAYLGQHTVPC